MNALLARLRPPGEAAGPGAAVRLVAQAGTLLLLLAHAARYRFLTDDAYISFRYARHLAEGAGLVFNAGEAPVEGYTNFLWVLLLAAGRAAGLELPELAHALSLAATVGLWWVVAVAAARAAPADRPYLAVVPPLLLAATRSVAVWSTGGLETRLFELCVVAGALRLAGEERGDRPLAWLWFAAAALTRPDGILLAGLAYGAAGLVRFRGGVPDAAWWRGPGFFAGVVALHFAFRLAYYGAWFPNTFYAKVTGFRWDTGLDHHAAFVLEYAAFLWVPLIVAGTVRAVRAGHAARPAILLSLLAGHAAYIASVGGDHFEYRPQDLYFPLAFLLVGEGLAALPRGRAGTAGAAAAVALLLLGLTAIPRQAHRQFPDVYRAGFPGWHTASPEGRVYLHPDRDPLLGLPGIRAVAGAHQRLLQRNSRAFVGIRQEEHRLFLEKVMPEAERLRGLVESGRIPADARFALDSVGAIPFVSRLPTLDRLGLTDAHVARHGEVSHDRLMAHERRASWEYAREAGVDFWALDSVHSLFRTGDPALPGLLDQVEEHGLPAYTADAGEDWILLGLLPQGEERARARFPALDFRPLRDPAVLAELRARGAR